jgi:sulfite reductase beta subunit-like hemoprotein
MFQNRRSPADNHHEHSPDHCQPGRIARMPVAIAGALVATDVVFPMIRRPIGIAGMFEVFTTIAEICDDWGGARDDRAAATRN